MSSRLTRSYHNVLIAIFLAVAVAFLTMTLPALIGQVIPIAPFLLCGDGNLDPDEECDDGNLEDGDACSGVCLLESRGNGRVDPGEECDDGNRNSYDGCSSDFKTEFCGDGILNNGIIEECDDGNYYSFDGCDACRQSRCGNDRIDWDPARGGYEECDNDWDNTSNDGCSADCRTERCGDGIQQSSEACDDGNLTNVDGCSSTCTVETPYCGDNSCDAGESNATCSSDCPTSCGDGTCEGAENPRYGEPNYCGADCGTNPYCGDGACNNNENANDCSQDCSPSCGNNVVESGEECESSWMWWLPPCDTSECKYLPVCGDGQVTGNEVCDGTNLGSYSCASIGAPASCSLTCANECKAVDVGYRVP